MTAELAKGLDALGNSSVNKPLYTQEGVNAKLLERFPSPFALPHMNRNIVTGSLNITVPEFTSLCPLTGQPDYAIIVIDYDPDQWCVESKALKLYLNSFRNQGEFHEACVNRICNDLIDLMSPLWIKVEGRFTPRGGIPFWPTAEWSKHVE
jgi:7-cyano-7-deazaguanine reductase